MRQAKDEFGERTADREILARCDDDELGLITINARDFEPLHREHGHAGILLCHDQDLPDTDPEGLARAVEVVFDQYGSDGIVDELVELDAWYRWLHR